ncbi:unnamed protein product [Haemonchus placei]|uniref:F-box domain-containing protein n=1 Tax=Haemonchus placei TaxID=6290 RepID=A0A0N4VVW3_HAEPC|nr:unnamed protein product [Haemonchus placei]
MLMSLPPLFENEEFLSLSQSAGQDLVVRYLVSSIDALSLVSRQRVYLLCSSLRNILQFTSQRGQSLTDLLNSIDGLQNGVCEEDDPPDSDTKLIDDETSFEHLQFTDSQFYYILAYSD